MSTPAAPTTIPIAAHREPPRRRLGDILVELGFCSRETVEQAVGGALHSGQLVGQLLLERGAVTADQLAIAIAHRFGLEHRTLDQLTLDFSAAALLPAADARRQGVVPVAFGPRDELLVAVANPADYLAFDDVSMLTGMRVVPVVVSGDDLDVLLRRVSLMDESLVTDEATSEPEPAEVVLRESAEDAPTIELIRSIIAQAIDRGASDIHFDPDEGALNVRYRIDGVMTDAVRVPRGQAAGAISPIKILAELDISERRLPQDGRIGFEIEGRRVDIRVAVMALVVGEAAVLRILDSGAAPLTLEDLGVSASDRERLAGPLRSSHGGILAIGPTGSGKTTTLYAVIALVRTPERTLMTIEEPLEYRFPGVNQIQVSERNGLTLRGRPARDRARRPGRDHGRRDARPRERAHRARRGPDRPPRALDAAHQRRGERAAAPHRHGHRALPRRLVDQLRDRPAPRAPRVPHLLRALAVPGELVGLAQPTVEVAEAVGCARCRNTGYLGRGGIYEVMPIDDEIRSMIVARAAAQEIARVAVANGMRRLRDDGLEKVRTGLTTLSELVRVLG